MTVPLSSSEYQKLRANNVRTHVRISDVLSYYGINTPGIADREFQYACPLHGDGNDSKPSARCYPDTNSTYCWACGISRDPIQWTKEKEGLNFWSAIKRIEDLYNVPRLPGHYEILKEESSGEKLLANITKTLANNIPKKSEPTIDDLSFMVIETLRLKSRDTTWDPKKRLNSWAAYWSTLHEFNNNLTSEEKTRSNLNLLLSKVNPR